MMYERFYVDKINRTFADNLLAAGLAQLVDDLLAWQEHGGAHDVVTKDCGAYYQLACKPLLRRDTVEQLDVKLCPVRPIRTTKNASAIPDDIPYFDYDADRARVNEYWAARQKGVDGDDLPALPEHWDILRAINPAALPGYNSLALNWWHLGDRQPEALLLLLDLYVTTPNDYAGAVETWKKFVSERATDIKPEATGLQIYNPDQGKGQNKPKADGLSVGNVSGFWLSEWLKALGLYQAGMTRLVRGAKDRKTFVIAPRELAQSDSRAVMSRFLGSMTSETSIKFDILAAVRYTRALLDHFNSEESLIQRLLGRHDVQRKLVAGFDTAFYKDLGNAVATMNVSFIRLPGWVIVNSRDDIALYNDPNSGLLEQLERVARQFDESHSDAFTLLRHLRDFISGDDLAAFFRFTNAFPSYYMGRREQSQYAYSFSTLFVERLIMSTEKRLTPILESEGFQNVAYAIRQSTVTAQYRKKQGDRRYDVRYGLGQELARKALYPDAFIAALSDFLHKYNAENAQVMETRPGPYRRSVKTSDIDEVVRLVDNYGSETVAKLLVAYGYARVPREDESDVPEVAQPEENEA